MKFVAITTLSAACLAMAGCGDKNAASDTGAMATESAAMDVAPAVTGGQAFANAAAASDAFEIATSKLALTSASAASVKKFAQNMITAHTASTAKLKAAAGQASPGITPDPAMTPTQQSTIDSLKTNSGKAFDLAYVGAQKDAHKMTLDTLRAYSANGDVPALKAFATSLVPTVTGHLNMAEGLKP